MRGKGVLRTYRRKLKKIMAPSLKADHGEKHVNLKMLKVCFGPCRCFSAAKR